MLEPSAHPHDAASPTRPPLRIGWKEYLEFTEWDLRRIRVKIDTGPHVGAGCGSLRVDSRRPGAN